MSAITIYKRNARLAEYTATLTIPGGYTLSTEPITFRMRAARGGATKVYAAATLVSAGSGTADVKYAWAADDLDTVGNYEVEWGITFSGDRLMVAPSDGYDIIKVIDEIDDFPAP